MDLGRPSSTENVNREITGIALSHGVESNTWRRIRTWNLSVMSTADGWAVLQGDSTEFEFLGAAGTEPVILV
jgi:hypothetical protein